METYLLNNKKTFHSAVLFLLLFITLNLKCYNILIRKNNLTIKEVEIYKNTKIWDLALAVQFQNLKDIKRLANKKNINFRDTVFDCNLLTWAVYNQKYESVKLLLELGADPNYCSEKILLKEKINPLILTAIRGLKIYPNIDYNELFSQDSTVFAEVEMVKYTKLLLKYTKKHINCEIKEKEHPVCALSQASAHNHEVFKLLLEYGGDLYSNCKIHYLTPLRQISIHSRIDNLSYACYNNFIDLQKPIKTNYNNKPVYILEFLRHLTFTLNSPQHKMKMELVDFLKNKGLDYNKEPIPSRLLREKKKEYLEQY